MAENEEVTYQLIRQNPVDYSLITQERTEKLELLIHLLGNSTNPIVLCGSKGVGKTTLLNVLQHQLNSSWQMCLIKGSADLSVEQIEAQLIATIPHTQTAEHFFASLAEKNKKIVLIIENAGRLAPYLISTLIDYAAEYPLLKIIFVLTHDDLAIKACSDSAIEDCHIIEVKPLSETQCSDFLQHLALKSTLKIPLHSITDSMIASLYQQTHGIPAKMIAQLPMLSHPKKNRPTSGWFPIILLGLLVAWLVLWFLSGHNTPSLASLNSLLKLLTD